MKKLQDIKILPLFHAQPVSEAQVSPNGNDLLYTYSSVNFEEDRYDSHIWIKRRDEKLRQLTHGRSSEMSPRWSPDGRNVLFLGARIGDKDKLDAKPKPQLHVLPMDGGEAEKLTYLEEAVVKPLWSPDGENILFMSRVWRGPRVEKSDVKWVTRIRYKMDGQGFFQGRFTQLFVISAKGGGVKQVTDGDWEVESACWSRDGKSILFSANMDPDADVSRYRSIYRIPIRGGKPQLLHNAKGGISNLMVSPDGKMIAYTGTIIEDPKLVWHKKTEVFLIPVKGGEPVCLTTKFDETVSTSNLVFCPESGGIYFTAPQKGSTHLFYSNIEGEISQVTSGEITVQSFSVSQDGGAIAYTATDANGPSEAYLIADNQTIQVTQSSPPLMKGIKISMPQEFWFTASDGVKVQGFVIKPHKMKASVSYPTVLQIHGGPRGAYGWGFTPIDHEFQVLASHGYGVIYTNPRGSTGFGNEFAAIISGHWGERDYLDLMEATDYAIQNNPWIDSKRLGVAGGSYGGWMTNWMIGHTKRFKAAVSMRSISNWLSMFGTSDIAYMDHDISWGTDPWKDPSKLLEKSPLIYAGNASTPTLFLQSENDYRCPMEQAEQMYMALKKQGIPSELVRFPEEGHELSRGGKPKHRIERLQHIIRWFDTYLK